MNGAMIPRASLLSLQVTVKGLGINRSLCSALLTSGSLQSRKRNVLDGSSDSFCSARCDFWPNPYYTSLGSSDPITVWCRHLYAISSTEPHVIYDENCLTKKKLCFTYESKHSFFLNTSPRRNKYTKKSGSRKEEDTEDEEEEDQVEHLPGKEAKLITARINSLRADLVLKAGLGMARNKVEAAFYESRIRVNGEKFLKKSRQLDIGDEVDIVRGPSPTNPDFLVVSRVEVLSAHNAEDHVVAKLRRFKSLIIENYRDTWRQVDP